MPSFTVIGAEVVRQLPAKDNWPAKNVVHLELNANGTDHSVTDFYKQDEALPQVGSTIEGEIGDQDKFDATRHKFQRPRRQFGGGGPRPRDPKETAAIQRQHSQEQAIRTGELAAKLGIFPEVKSVKALADILVTLTDFWVKDIDGPTAESEFPFDAKGLPEAGEGNLS